MGAKVNTDPNKSSTIKVQILLEGEDAHLYKQIRNKKQFLIYSMKVFSQDEKLRFIFFNDEHAKEQKQSATKQLPAKTPPQTQTSSEKSLW